MSWPHLSSMLSPGGSIHLPLNREKTICGGFQSLSSLLKNIMLSTVFLWVIMFYLFICSLIYQTVFDLLPCSGHHSREVRTWQWASCNSCPQVAQELCGRCRPVKTQCTGMRARRWANQGRLHRGRDIYLLYLTVKSVSSNTISSICLIRRQNGQPWDVSWSWKSELEGRTPQDIYSSAASTTLSPPPPPGRILSWERHDAGTLWAKCVPGPLFLCSVGREYGAALSLHPSPLPSV